MALRRVVTGGRLGGRALLPTKLHWLLDVQGSFPGRDGQGAYLLMGKYEVTARQYQTVLAAAKGRPCPVVDDAMSALPIVDIRRVAAAPGPRPINSTATAASTNHPITIPPTPGSGCLLTPR